MTLKYSRTPETTSFTAYSLKTRRFVIYIDLHLDTMRRGFTVGFHRDLRWQIACIGSHSDVFTCCQSFLLISCSLHNLLGQPPHSSWLAGDKAENQSIMIMKCVDFLSLKKSVSFVLSPCLSSCRAKCVPHEAHWPVSAWWSGPSHPPARVLTPLGSLPLPPLGL